jgi:DNA-binding NarL/FixJ family response regulator
LQKVRAQDWGKNLPAIVLTIRDTDVEGINKSMQTGTLAYLSKADISREQIVNLVDQQLTNNT